MADTSVTEGAIADQAVTGDNPGSNSAKLRGLNKLLADVWDSVNHWLKVTQGTLGAGEDLVNNRLLVQQKYTPFAISTATTTVVKSGAGAIGSIRVIGGTLGNVTAYDNTAASGTVLLPTVTPVANEVLLENVQFNTGLTIVTAAATVIVGGYI